MPPAPKDPVPKERAKGVEALSKSSAKAWKEPGGECMIALCSEFAVRA